VEKAALQAFKSVTESFLGNHKAEKYREIVSDLLTTYKAMGCNMSLKVHFLDSTSSLRILAPSVTSTERDFIRTFSTWKSGTRASGASVCYLTTAGPSREIFHRRHTAEKQPQLLLGNVETY
jgi:hypothetical protein